MRCLISPQAVVVKGRVIVGWGLRCRRSILRRQSRSKLTRLGR
jgi:hypothetical protein